MRSFIHVYTGNGKGKTTAALGLALRAAGAGMKVYIGQFAKGTYASEHVVLDRLSKWITVEQFGTKRFVGAKPSEQDRRLARQGLDKAGVALASGKYGLVVLDEACFAVDRNIFSVKELLDVLQQRHKGTEVVVTGRNAPSELKRIADLVTEMKEVKHYFRSGVKARRGIEM